MNLIPKVGPYSRYKELPGSLVCNTGVFQHSETFQYVIIKQFEKIRLGSQNQIQTFMKRALALKNLQIPNVVPFTEAYETESSIFLVRPYLEVFPLADLPDQHNINPADLLSIWKTIAQAILLLHQNKIAPNNIKISNIFYFSPAKICITDLYELPPSVNYALETPRSNHVSFLAPEILHQTVPPGKEADLWALGVVLAFLFNRGCPWQSSNLFSLLNKISHANYHVPQESTPKAVLNAIEMLVVPDPAARRMPDLSTLIIHKTPESSRSMLPPLTKLQMQKSESLTKSTEYVLATSRHNYGESQTSRNPRKGLKTNFTRSSMPSLISAGLASRSLLYPHE